MRKLSYLFVLFVSVGAHANFEKCNLENIKNVLMEGFSSFLGHKVNEATIPIKPEYLEVKGKRIMSVMTSIGIIYNGSEFSTPNAYNFYFDAEDCSFINGMAVDQLEKPEVLGGLPTGCQQERLFQHAMDITKNLSLSGKLISDFKYPMNVDQGRLLYWANLFGLYHIFKMERKPYVLAVFYDAVTCNEVSHYISEQIPFPLGN